MLVLIWCAVWFEALQTGRAGANTWMLAVSQIGFFAGAAAAVGALVYLKARRRSVFDCRRVEPTRPVDPPKPRVRRQLQL